MDICGHQAKLHLETFVLSHNIGPIFYVILWGTPKKMSSVPLTFLPDFLPISTRFLSKRRALLDSSSISNSPSQLWLVSWGGRPTRTSFVFLSCDDLLHLIGFPNSLHGQATRYDEMSTAPWDLLWLLLCQVMFIHLHSQVHKPSSSE